MSSTSWTAKTSTNTMKHNKKEVVLDFDLPGFTKKNVKVKVNKDSVAVNAEKKQEKKVQKKDFFHKETSYSSFSYATTIPEVDPKKAKTKFSKGKLKIIAPRKK